MAMPKVGIAGPAMILGASVLTGLLSYGTYGYLKDKKKWSSWKAGAATGGITGALSVLGLYLMGAAAGEPVAALGATGIHKTLPNVGLRKRFPSMYRQFGALVVNKLNGCSACG